jgi:hypothetical protein
MTVRPGPEGMPSMDPAAMFGELLKKSFEEQYAGKEDYVEMKRVIDSDFSILSGEIQIPIVDPVSGQIRMKTKKIQVYDDLGNVIESPNELQVCKSGCYVHIDDFYECLRCGGKYCREHVRWVNKDPNKPLCHFGPDDRRGCFYKYEDIYDGDVTDWVIEQARAKLELEKIHDELDDVKHTRKEKKKARKKGFFSFLFNQSQPRLVKEQPVINHQSRPEHYAPVKITCTCGTSPVGGWKVNCFNCNNSFTTNQGLNCPRCRTKVNNINCHRCGKTIEV